MPPYSDRCAYSRTTWSNRERSRIHANAMGRKSIREGISRAVSDYDDSSLRRSTRSRRARVATVRFRARKLFLFIAPFSAGRLRLNHCASPYWMGRTRCMVYSHRHSERRLVLPLKIRPSSLTAVNKVSNIPFDRTPIVLGEEAREKNPEKLFLDDVFSWL